jgi:hypothetical protein
MLFKTYCPQTMQESLHGGHVPVEVETWILSMANAAVCRDYFGLSTKLATRATGIF